MTRDPADVDVGHAIRRMLDTERHRALDLGDPVLTLRNAERLRRHLMACLDELEVDGPRAVRALRRRGWSFARIAGETGLSDRRVADFARGTYSCGIDSASPVIH
ncbi:hypothetical protein D0Z08_10165 [Nocardioides immobilis]|uniref:Helix-turn-helix domain-containing protein n=1 Tax=Nocardioides immobilis TaxID=2049295 RepID=A0A417Y303_9ACTN|nr:hypothetical protein [Nocardioides immobilis]RHW27033.1 hypothetical protein D0Z08_10165 [Nocardioides immobilis]